MAQSKPSGRRGLSGPGAVTESILTNRRLKSSGKRNLRIALVIVPPALPHVCRARGRKGTARAAACPPAPDLRTEFYSAQTNRPWLAVASSREEEANCFRAYASRCTDNPSPGQFRASKNHDHRATRATKVEFVSQDVRGDDILSPEKVVTVPLEHADRVEARHRLHGFSWPWPQHQARAFVQARKPTKTAHIPARQPNNVPGDAISSRAKSGSPLPAAVTAAGSG